MARRYPATIAEYDASDPKHLEMLYRELSRIYHSYIPEEYRDEHITGWGWSNFLVACVFYDPPETRLLEFAAYDDPPYDPAPVRSLPEVVEEMIYAERRMWIETIGEIERHYLESSKDEGSSLVAKVWDQNPHLEKQRLQTWEKVLDRYYIEVNEDTTEDDVRRAFRMIAASRKEQHEKRSKGGRPPRDPLIALQAAILYDDHNPRDSKDGRRRQWTFERLAEELPGVFSGSAAKKHVIEGREYRQGKALPEV